MDSFPSGEVAVLTQDNYYLSEDRQVQDAQGVTNFDLPSCIDRGAFASDIASLKRGEGIDVPEYNFNNNAADAKTIRIPSAPIIITEGLFVFHFTEVFEQMDLSVFVDAPEQLRLQRRIHRDAIERGYDEADVRYRWANHVLPAENSFLYPFRSQVDLLVDNGGALSVGIEAIQNHIQAILNT